MLSRWVVVVGEGGGGVGGETVLIGQLFCYFSVRYLIDSLR